MSMKSKYDINILFILKIVIMFVEGRIIFFGKICWSKIIFFGFVILLIFVGFLNNWVCWFVNVKVFVIKLCIDWGLII